MATKVSSSDLDSFLQGKTENTGVIDQLATPNIPQKEPLQQIGETLSQSNNALGELVRLVEGVNNLVDKFGGFFNPGRKQERIGGNTDYGQIIEQAQNTTDPILPTNPAPAIASNVEKDAKRVLQWFKQTLSEIPEQTTAKEILLELSEKDKELNFIMTKVIKNESITKEEYGNLQTRASAKETDKEPQTPNN